MMVAHRINQGRFNGSYRTLLKVSRRSKLETLQELADIEEARRTAVYLKPAPINDELKKQFMSVEALALKRKTPMFTK